MSNTVYRRNGVDFFPADDRALVIEKQLPPGNYIIQETPDGVLYFARTGEFDLPNKIYGSTSQTADRIINTFMDRPSGTGVLLEGEKGSGKTMLTKLISARCAMERQIPTIVVSTPWVGERFNKLIQSIQQPAIIIFDEFEKVYDSDAQEQILTLLDGVFPSKKLFMFTVNNQYRVDTHMHNRPGRLFYRLSFSGLDAEFIREYCQDTLDNKNYIETVVKVSAMFGAFNFDMLKALVEEMNRYKENPVQALKMLNAKPDRDHYGEYKLTVYANGVKQSSHWPDSIRGNPLSCNEHTVTIYSSEENDSDEDEQQEQVTITLTPNHVVEVSALGGKKITYRNGVYTVEYTLEEKKGFNIEDFI